MAVCCSFDIYLTFKYAHMMPKIICPNDAHLISKYAYDAQNDMPK